MITYKQLKYHFTYNELTGYFYWRNPTNKSIKVNSIAGHRSKVGYIRIVFNNRAYLAHRLAWFYVHGYMPENDIDHEDRIKYHNWISNLREISKQCNLQNCNIQKNNKTGITGVCYHKKRKTHIVYIRKNKKTVQIGYCKDFVEAVCMRLAAEQCLGWDKCNLNSSAYQYVEENVQKYYCHFELRYAIVQSKLDEIPCVMPLK